MPRNARLGRILGVLTVLTASSGLSVPEATAATLFWGQTVNYQYYFPSLSDPYQNADNGNKLVGAGIEVLDVSSDMGTLDISDTNILVDFTGLGGWSGAGIFNGFVITDVFSSIPDFTSVSINLSTNMSGFDASHVSFTSDQIFVNWRGLDFTPSTIVSLDVGTISPVPLPAALPMFLAGLAGLGYVGWRKKTRATEA